MWEIIYIYVRNNIYIYIYMWEIIYIYIYIYIYVCVRKNGENLLFYWFKIISSCFIEYYIFVRNILK